MDEKRERGLGFFGEVINTDDAADMRQHIGSEDFGKECATWAADFAFGTVWTRDGLDRRLRSCVVLGILMALRQTDELKIHFGIALRNGLSIEELEEVLYLSVPYAGFPAANSAKVAMIEALREYRSGATPGMGNHPSGAGNDGCGHGR